MPRTAANRGLSNSAGDLWSIRSRWAGMLTAVDDLLGRMPVFAGLADEARGALAERLTRRPERRGSVVFAEGEPGDRVYIILNGKVKISRRSRDGRENLLAVLGPGRHLRRALAVRPRPAYRDRQRGHRRRGRLAGALGAPALAHRASRGRGAAAEGAGPPAAAHQRGDGRPGLHRRTRSGGQAAAGPRGAFRRARAAGARCASSTV